MPTVALREPKQFTRIPALRKPQPRSAGASKLPMRSENIAELVHFFQTQEGTEEEPVVGFQANTNTNTDMDILKAGQRRLRTMGQTKPERTSVKGSDVSISSEKRKAKDQHLLALQREGLLPGLEGMSNKPRPSRTKQEKQGVERSFLGIEDRPSRTKQDVEAIGRPWLDDALASLSMDEERSSSQIELPLHGLRDESLSLGDLAALVEFSVSFPDLYSHDSQPPPYQAQDEAQLQPEPQPQPQPQPQAPNPSNAPETDRRDYGRSEDIRQLWSSAQNYSRDSHTTEGDNTAPSKPVQVNRNAGAASRQAQNKPETDKNDDDSCCELSCECDDAKSLAVLLRATEKLGIEKKRTSQKETPTATTAVIVAPSTAVASSSKITTTLPTAESGQKNPAPHSLNQGVTDTPLFVRNLIENRTDGVEQSKKTNNNPSGGADQVLPPSQANTSPSNYLNVGPIPLKLVAECMPPIASKSPSPPQLSSSDARPGSKLNGEITLLQPPSSTVGPSSASFPRPRALLSPIPIQSRRARSVTPDIASDGPTKGKKKGKKPPLYVIADSAPLPPPAKPLPSLPPSAGLQPGDKTVEGDRKVSTPAPPASAPLEYREEGRDSPVLGMNSHRLQRAKSPVGSQPSSPYSNRSTDISDGSRNSSDAHSSRTASPAVSRPESRRGRADQVHTLRMRDIDSKRKKMAVVMEPRMHSAKYGNPQHTQPVSQNYNDQVKLDRRNRISTIPDFPLPKNPPVNAQGTPNFRRRGSTSSLPGSISTMNGYEGGLSRSVSVTSGSIDSFPVRHGKAIYVSRNATENSVHRNFQLDSPLPSSDEEQHNPRARNLKNKSHLEENGKFETRQGNQHLVNGKKRQSNKQNPAMSHEQFSSPPEISQQAILSGDPQMNNHLLRHLESRVVTLERQNKMLQAALLAALDVGVSHDADSVHSRSTSTASSSSRRVPTISEGLMPALNNLGIDNIRQRQGKTAQRHHTAHGVYMQDALARGSRGSFETTSSRVPSDLDAGASRERRSEWNEAIRKNRK